MSQPQQAKAIAIVQARMGSTRLPGKSLASLGDYTLLGLLLTRLKATRELDSIVVATTVGAEDDAIKAEAHRYHISCIQGSAEDVLGRFVAAAAQHRAGIYVRVCADNPLTDPGQVDRLVRFARTGGYDLAYNHRPECGLPDGVGAEAMTDSTLEKLDLLATDPSHREHVTLYAYDNSREFNIGRLDTTRGEARPEYRLDVDYPEDLQFIRELCLALSSKEAPLWSTAQIIATLDRHPELLKLRRPRSESYARSG